MRIVIAGGGGFIAPSFTGLDDDDVDGFVMDV